MNDPRNAAAPGWETEGEAKTQQGHADTLIVPSDPGKRQDAPGPSTPQEREERAQRARRRLREAALRRRVGRALNVMCADMGDRDPFGSFTPSEAWTRNLGNDLVTAWGFEPEHIERRYGITRRAGASA